VAELRAARAEVQARVKRQVIDRLTISKETVIMELGKIGFANMEDFTKLNAEGDVAIDLSKAGSFQMAAIQELTVDEYLEGRGKDARTVRRTKIKLYDKRAALVEIGRELGLFGPTRRFPLRSQCVR
jgi:phage terminase small subunit